MSAGRLVAGDGTVRFRRRLFITMTLIVALVTVIATFLVQRRMEADLRWNLDRRFESEFDALLAVQEATGTAVVDRCRSLVRQPRIHAAIEDNGLDLLYLIADDALRALMPAHRPTVAGGAVPPLDGESMFQVLFYRFLDADGAVIPPPAGHVDAHAAAGLHDLAMRALPEQEVVGYITADSGADAGKVHQIVACPIISSETARPIAALMLVFKPLELPERLLRNGVKSGVWTKGHLQLQSCPPADLQRMEGQLTAACLRSNHAEGSLPAQIEGSPYLLHYRQMNPKSDFHRGVLVSLFPLADSAAHLSIMRWQIIGAGVLLLMGGLAASQFLSARLSVPVEKLAIVSSENAEQLGRAEATLEIRNQQLHTRNKELQAALADLKDAQHRVIQQERLSALGQMASGVAHDFNNALVPILGFSELLQISPGAMEDRALAKSYIGMIHTAAGDAAKVVSRLKQFYRKQEEGDLFDALDVGKLVLQILTLTRPKWKDQAQAAGVMIEIVPELGEVPPVHGDESALREVLTNLIFNAVDAMPSGGRITARTRCDGNFAVIEVADTGTGMSEEVRKRCLEPFFTTKGERGTGLGLSMVFGIIQRHTGTVDIESEPGKGTTFILRLPLQGMNAPAAEAAADVAMASRNLGILVVDDEPQARDFLTAALTGDGHRVEVANDGADGLRRFREGTFDVVLTDKAMPGMSGDQMASAIKLMKPGTPVILLTGFGQFLDKGELPSIDVLLSKPIGIEKLREALNSVLCAAA